MDPNEALEMLIKAALDGKAQELRDAADDLARWLEDGGFRPGPQAAYSAALRAGYNPLPDEGATFRRGPAR